MVAVGRAAPEVVEQVLAVQEAVVQEAAADAGAAGTAPAGATVAPRSRRALSRAAREGRLLAAERDGELAGWVLVEPCVPGTVELGGMYVLPRHRQGEVFRALTAAALSLHPRALVVTMDARFAAWLVREHGFTRSSLWGLTLASWGMFLWRRVAPWRLRAALAHVRGARAAGREVHYLMRVRPAGEVPLL